MMIFRQTPADMSWISANVHDAAGAYGLCTASSQGSTLGGPLHVLTREFRQQLPGEEYYLIDITIVNEVEELRYIAFLIELQI